MYYTFCTTFCDSVFVKGFTHFTPKDFDGIMVNSVRIVHCRGGGHTYPPKVYISLIHQFPFPLNKILADSCFYLVFTPLNPVVVTVLSAFYWFVIGRQILSINVYQLFVDRDFFYRMTYVKTVLKYW